MQARKLISGLVISALAGFAYAGPQAVRIGILTDMSGVYSGVGGKGSVIAAQMAADDFGGKVLGKPIEILSADHQNKADIGVSVAREWFDVKGVDMVNDLLNSGVGIAVQKLAAEKKRITINNGAGSTALTNKECTATGIHYAYDTYALAKGTGTALIKQGLDSWYFLTADYAFGASLERDSSSVVTAYGGKVMGSVKHPLATTDFSSYLLQAQNSGAKVVALANAGGDFSNAVKQAKEFGLKQTLAGLLVFDSDIKALGLATAQGMKYTTAFYWDLDDDNRAWANKFRAKAGFMPSMVHAGVYSSTMHYLNAIKAANSDAADAVMVKMKGTPINDFFARNGVIREDGRMVHEMYLMEIKKPAESKADYDIAKVIATIPADTAFAPLAKSECPLVKK